MSLATVNPFATTAGLSPLEAEVLWEYAKLGDKIKRITNLAKQTADEPNTGLEAELRALEPKMGLVLTLYKASVWGVIQESQAEAEMVAARAAAEEEARAAQHGHEGDYTYDASYDDGY
ncbi:hypothetical protein Q5752_002279 [Cryptotrichosporon argae]